MALGGSVYDRITPMAVVLWISIAYFNTYVFEIESYDIKTSFVLF